MLPVVERFVDDAVAANLDRVEILHGKGTGALRQAVRERLADLPSVADFEDAPWDEGGPGVTYVTLG
ncbi:MAG: Smr/MutS family protein [Rhodothermales bacterium]